MKHSLNIRILIALIYLIWALPTSLCIASEEADLLKAGFLGKFAEFTNYPSAPVSPDDQPFVITFLGDTSIQEAAGEVYENGKIKKRKVVIRLISDPTHLGETDMLFIAGSEKKRLPTVLALLRGKKVLIVSNSPGFASKGVHINLYKTKRGTLHFEMNRNRLEKDGFKVHLRLMELAKIVNE